MIMLVVNFYCASGPVQLLVWFREAISGSPSVGPSSRRSQERRHRSRQTHAVPCASSQSHVKVQVSPPSTLDSQCAKGVTGCL
ncbi:hypothetical protein AAFF_G00006790 [Aldrovandia affinis]|uniref:Uncharacterized protein n=1 Tax=Aldrovandia affinis TaxID=143900 RepID=A0AAD7TDV1_9TELE|nr:hypothetical protein AAFF_G00006790 [Aldrovandia affinis]